MYEFQTAHMSKLYFSDTKQSYSLHNVHLKQKYIGTNLLECQNVIITLVPTFSVICPFRAPTATQQHGEGGGGHSH